MKNRSLKFKKVENFNSSSSFHNKYFLFPKMISNNNNNNILSYNDDHPPNKGIINNFQSNYLMNKLFSFSKVKLNKK